MTHHTDILTTIVAHKRREIEMQQEAVSFSHLEHLISTYHAPPRRSLRQALLESSTGIIAEFKRKSPSKGWISRHAEAETVATGYTRAGAAALSVLTDEFFFGGNLSDIKAIRPHTDLPILRKDFILSEYQLYQARAIQADAVLLIAAVLSRKECRQLTRKAHELGLEVLLEIHSEHELEYLEEEVDLAGINNRHLSSFTTDVEHSFRLGTQLPSGLPRISESGISSPETVRALRASGFSGFLIGETFMKTEDPGETLSNFIEQIQTV